MRWLRSGKCRRSILVLDRERSESRPPVKCTACSRVGGRRCPTGARPAKARWHPGGATVAHMRGIGTLALTALLVTTTAGCSSLSDDVTDSARIQMARVHLDTMSCLRRGIAADPGADRMRELISTSCTDTRSEDPADQHTIASSFREGSWLVDLDDAGNTWTLEVLDLGFSYLSQGHFESHRAVIQCWTATMTFDPAAMTPPTQVDCPAGIEDNVEGRKALEVDSLVTAAPSTE